MRKYWQPCAKKYLSSNLKIIPKRVMKKKGGGKWWVSWEWVGMGEYLLHVEERRGCQQHQQHHHHQELRLKNVKQARCMPSAAGVSWNSSWLPALALVPMHPLLIFFSPPTRQQRCILRRGKRLLHKYVLIHTW